jgi:hypothetical protein
MIPPLEQIPWGRLEKLSLEMEAVARQGRF